jgi:DNA-3-methyladenine glycosylase II
MATRDELARDASRHLSRVDPVMRALIRQVGPYRLQPDRRRFRMLAYSIVSQQLSVKAARTIRERLVALAGGDLTPDSVLRLPPDKLRSAGLSRNKAAFLHDLAAAATDGRLSLEKIGRKPDEDIITELTQVKGVGRWTAQMFLMFSLGRPDVLPVGDLGIRAAMRNLYQLPELPEERQAHEIGGPWRPYATVASWYCWRSLELPKGTPNGATEGSKRNTSTPRGPIA